MQGSQRGRSWNTDTAPTSRGRGRGRGAENKQAARSLRTEDAESVSNFAVGRATVDLRTRTETAYSGSGRGDQLGGTTTAARGRGHSTVPEQAGHGSRQCKNFFGQREYDYRQDSRDSLRTPDKNVYQNFVHNRFRDSDLTYEGLHRVLHYASYFGDLDCVQSIVGNVESRFSEYAAQSLINQPNEKYGNSTSLMISNGDVTAFLLHKGADSSMKSNAFNKEWGNTVFHWAVWYADIKRLRLLLEHNPSGALMTNRFGETPLKLLHYLRKDAQKRLLDIHKRWNIDDRFREADIGNPRYLDEIFREAKDVLEEFEMKCLEKAFKLPFCVETVLKCHEESKRRAALLQPVSPHIPDHPNQEQGSGGVKGDEPEVTAQQQAPNPLQNAECGLYSSADVKLLENCCSSKLRERIAKERDQLRYQQQKLECENSRLSSKCLEFSLSIKDLQDEITALKQISFESKIRKDQMMTLIAENSALKQKILAFGGQVPLQEENISPCDEHHDTSLTQELSPKQFVWHLAHSWDNAEGEARAGLNSALESLSSDLYSSEFHFVAEMIQNADDSQAQHFCVMISEDAVTISDDGEPFDRNGVRALCHIGKSCKLGGHDIGQKGLGFKSVFAVTDCPTVWSGPWSFGFEIGRDNVSSLLTPHWIDAPFEQVIPESLLDEQRNTLQGVPTVIYLPLKRYLVGTLHRCCDLWGDGVRKSVSEIFQINRYSLLFLNNLRKADFLLFEKQICTTAERIDISESLICERLRSGGLPSGITAVETVCIFKQLTSKGEISVSETTFSTDIPRVEKRYSERVTLVQALVRLPSIVTHPKRQGCGESVVKICFPERQSRNPVYAFLPVEGCRPGGGFPFVLHADWILTAGRESIKENERWNVELRKGCAKLIANTIDESISRQSQMQQTLIHHLLGLLELSGVTSWWKHFIDEVKEAFKNETKTSLRRANDWESFQQIFPYSVDEMLSRFNVLILPVDSAVDNDIVQNLSVTELIELSSAEFFRAKHELQDSNWWRRLFSRLDAEIDVVGTERMRVALLGQPILNLCGSERREVLTGRLCLVAGPNFDLEDSFPGLALPFVQLLSYESLEEQLVLRKLWDEVNQDLLVRLILEDHIAMAQSDWKIKYSRVVKGWNDGIWYLMNHKDVMYTEWRELTSPHMDGEFAEVSDVENAHNIVPTIYLPVEDGAVILATRTVLPCFMSIPAEYPCDKPVVARNLIQGFDSFTRMRMEFFLLEIGCSLPLHLSTHFEADTLKASIQAIQAAIELTIQSSAYEDEAAALSTLSRKGGLEFVHSLMEALNKFRSSSELYRAFLNECQLAARSPGLIVSPTETNRQILECEDLKSILRICQNNLHILDPTNISTAMHRAAQIESRKSDSREAGVCIRIWNTLQVVAVQMTGGFSPQATSNLMLALAKLRLDPGDNLVLLMVRRAHETLDSFKDKDCIRLLQALALLDVEECSGLTDSLTSQVALFELEAKQIVAVLWSLAKLEVKPRNEVLHLLQRLTTQDQELQHHQASNLIWAVAKLKLEPWPALIESMKSWTIEQAHCFNGHDIANVMWAFAKLDLQPGDLVTRKLRIRALAAETRFTRVAAKNLTWALVKLKMPPWTEVEDAWRLQKQQQAKSTSDAADFGKGIIGLLEGVKKLTAGEIEKLTIDSIDRQAIFHLLSFFENPEIASDPNDPACFYCLPRELRSKFAFQGVLGRGSSGTVVKVTERQGARLTFALKVSFPTSSSFTQQELRKLKREATSLSMIRSEHVVSFHDFGTSGDQVAWIRMEYLDGKSLDQMIAVAGNQRKLFAEKEAIRVGMDILSGLDSVHTNNLVHRDIKPSNIVQKYKPVSGTRQYVYVLIDFGLVLSTDETCDCLTGDSNTVAGTLPYMSPEMLERASTAGPQSDLWSVAVTLFELVTGQLPFQADHPYGERQWVKAIVHGVVPDVRDLLCHSKHPVSRTFSTALQIALKKETSERVQSARDLIQAFHSKDKAYCECLRLLAFEVRLALLQCFKVNWENCKGKPWKDTPEQGMEYWTEELASNSRGKIKKWSQWVQLALQSGNSNAWDVTLFNYILLESKVHPLPSDSQDYKEVSEICDWRNTLAHFKDGVTELDFNEFFILAHSFIQRHPPLITRANIDNKENESSQTSNEELNAMTFIDDEDDSFVSCRVTDLWPHPRCVQFMGVVYDNLLLGDNFLGAFCNDVETEGRKALGDESWCSPHFVREVEDHLRDLKLTGSAAEPSSIHSNTIGGDKGLIHFISRIRMECSAQLANVGMFGKTPVVYSYILDKFPWLVPMLHRLCINHNLEHRFQGQPAEGAPYFQVIGSESLHSKATTLSSDSSARVENSVPV